MDGFKRSIKFQLMESKSFILGFWTTVIILNIFFLILNTMNSIDFNIGLTLGFEDNIKGVSIAGINLMIILISLLVYNFERNYSSFPLAICLSMSRTQYFLSFLLDNAFVALVFASIQAILLKIDPYFIKIIGKPPLYEYFFFNTKTDNLFYIIFTLFIIFLTFISFWNLIASLNYKFGYKMWLVLIGSNLLLSIFNIDIIYKFMEYLGSVYNIPLTSSNILSLIATSALLYVLNYLIIMQTNIKKSIS